MGRPQPQQPQPSRGWSAPITGIGCGPGADITSWPLSYPRGQQTTSEVRRHDYLAGPPAATASVLSFPARAGGKPRGCQGTAGWRQLAAAALAASVPGFPVLDGPLRLPWAGC